MKRNILFDISSTVPYSPSPLSCYTCVFDEESELVRIQSDVELIRLGAVNDPSILAHVQRCTIPLADSSGLELSDFSQSVTPKRVDNITDAYQYGKFLEREGSSADSIVSKLKEMDKDDSSTSKSS